MYQKKLKFYFLVFILFFTAASSVIAQKDSIIIAPNDNLDQQVIEDFIQSISEEGDFDFNTAFEKYLGRPLNINKASQEELENLRMLSDIQIADLLRHRETFGDLITLHELQTIPSFDLPTIQRVLPFLSTYVGLDDYKVKLHQMLLKGESELYVRWQRVLETQKGFTPLEEGQTGSRYLGDPNKIYIRYRQFYQNRLSIGFTAEKDAGEEFFKGSNQQGFDFYSAHLFLNRYSKTIKAVALGDYKLSMGQGLIRYSGFGAGKSSYVTNVRRGGQSISKYSSVNEANFMRGAAATIGLGENLEFSGFVSFRNRDANIIINDTLDFDESLEFSSLQISGLHRTESEIQDKNALKQTSYGGILKYKNRRSHIALNVLRDHFDKKLQRRPQPYNRFYFNGDRLLNASLDYSRRFDNIYFFGETAWSDNNQVATLNGLLIGLDRYAEVAVVHRYFPRAYQAIDANPFAEKRGGRNEQGFYIGVNLRPAKNWKVATYVDTYRHPWLLFDADGPSKGIDYLAKVTYWKKRDMEVYIQLRTETKQINNSAAETKIDPLVNLKVFRLRLHFAKKVNKGLELRSRIYWGFSEQGSDARLTGFAAYQDILIRPVGHPLSVTARFAIFDTDGYAIRFYAYENDLLYAFSVPAYYNKGTRYYINLRYKGIRNLTLELRYARTLWTNQTTFGSGLDEIDGNHRSEVKAQIKYKF